MHSSVRYAGQPGALVGPVASEKMGPSDAIMKLQYEKPEDWGPEKKNFLNSFLNLLFDYENIKYN